MQEHTDDPNRLILLPDAPPSRVPDRTPRVRIMWGQHLLDDLVAGRYRTFICAVNEQDNSRGIISQLAAFLPTSQWDEQSITAYAQTFSRSGRKAKVLKYDMDRVEVLAILRPPGQDRLSLPDLSAAFSIAVEMIRGDRSRQPSASVSFLEARANLLVDRDGRAPSFEGVLQAMNQAGYTGDVYPSPSMWRAAPTGVFARYPFSESLDARRNGGS
jgi:hypothetical protein